MGSVKGYGSLWCRGYYCSQQDPFPAYQLAAQGYRMRLILAQMAMKISYALQCFIDHRHQSDGSDKKKVANYGITLITLILTYLYSHF